MVRDNLSSTVFDEWVEIHPKVFISRTEYNNIVFDFKIPHHKIYSYLVEQREMLKRVKKAGQPLIFQEKKTGV